MTWRDLVRYYSPSATDETADFILFNETAFPHTYNMRILTKQISSAIRSSKNNIKRCEMCGMKEPFHKGYCSNSLTDKRMCGHGKMR